MLPLPLFSAGELTGRALRGPKTGLNVCERVGGLLGGHGMERRRQWDFEGSTVNVEFRSGDPGLVLNDSGLPCFELAESGFKLDGSSRDPTMFDDVLWCSVLVETGCGGEATTIFFPVVEEGGGMKAGGRSLEGLLLLFF